MGHQYRPLLEVFREALRTLQNEPGPMIPAKVELMEYLRERIAEHEGLDRSTAANYPARDILNAAYGWMSKRPCAGANPQDDYSSREPFRQ